jgi:hypothetical protein
MKIKERQVMAPTPREFLEQKKWLSISFGLDSSYSKYINVQINK